MIARRETIPTAPDPAPSRVTDLVLWQLADSAFPTSGFAHSQGLEAAWRQGEVRSSSELEGWVQASLRQAGRAALPFVTAAHREPERLAAFDRLCDAFITNHIANRASRLQGRALGLAVNRIFNRDNRCWNSELKSPFAHCAPLFGACLSRIGLDLERSARLYLFLQVRGMFSAAVRLNILGPMQAQALQLRLAPLVEEVGEECSPLGLEEVAQTSPLLDLWQGMHDRLYSRLFQS